MSHLQSTMIMLHLILQCISYSLHLLLCECAAIVVAEKVPRGCFTLFLTHFSPLKLPKIFKQRAISGPKSFNSGEGQILGRAMSPVTGGCGDCEAHGNEL